MNLKDLLALRERSLAEAVAERDAALARQTAVLDGVTAAKRSTLTEDEDREVREASEAKRAAAGRISALEAEVANLRDEVARDAAVEARTERAVETGARPAYDHVARVGYEERTYAPHKERGFVGESGGRAQFREGVNPGIEFERDLIRMATGDPEAQERLARHIREEHAAGVVVERATGTGAFAGLTVPQYLTDYYAPKASAGRPFANAVKRMGGGHVLPSSGMTVEISRITTASSAAIQTSQNSAVAEVDMDDTQLSVPVLTAAGQQTVSFQAVSRSSGVESVVLGDLFRRNAAIIDNTMLNQATNGLTNVATSVAYTDASPSVADLYPKFFSAQSAMESALLDQSSGETIAVMHPRRWQWLNSQLSSTFPLLTQPGVRFPQAAGENYGSGYGDSVRGILPNGVMVVVDSNVATNLGTGTDEDEIYIVDPGEIHLWEDSAAPLVIRAEQTNAASLGVLFVVSSFFAFTHVRQPHAQKIAGTGLVTPTWA